MVARRLLVSFLVLLAVAVNAAAGMFWWTTLRLWRDVSGAPILEELDSGPQATLVYDSSGRQLYSFYTQRRIHVPLGRVSPHLIHAVLAAEDQRFYDHHGLDARRIAGAALSNARSGRIVEGGSTITQQLVRNATLSSRRTYGRKLREMLLAVETESRYSKREILETYLNRVYFGDGYYGIEAAARGYFGKPAAALGPEEGALLAGLIKAPSVLSPNKAPDRGRSRRNHVLRVMRDRGWLTSADYRTAVASQVAARRPAPERDSRLGLQQGIGLYFRSEVRDALIDRFGEEMVLTGGLRVHTTLDSRLQAAAERIMAEHAAAVERQTRRRSKQPLQGSLVALDARTGHVLAMVGGRDFDESPFNRATQSRRQPGSAFKPLIFAAALERGWNPGSMLQNIDVPIEGPSGPWLPEGEHEASEYTLRRALKVSSNRAAAQLLQSVGVSSALEMAHRLGIRSDLPAVPSLALGTGEVTLFELTSAYGAFANDGLLAAPMLITRVDDFDGTVLWENAPSSRRVLSPSTAFLISNILSDVVTSGTAANVRAYGFTLPAAGKTGTTNDFADTWFIGYTPRIVTGVWLGFDRPEMIMNRGFAATIAVPAWARFMKEATAGDAPEWLTTPPGVEKVAVCSVSGLLATYYCHAAAARSTTTYEVDASGGIREVPPITVSEEYFALGRAPMMPCNVHTEWEPTYGPPGSVGATADTVPEPLPGVVGTTYVPVPPLPPQPVPPLPD